MSNYTVYWYGYKKEFTFLRNAVEFIDKHLSGYEREDATVTRTSDGVTVYGGGIDRRDDPNDQDYQLPS